MQSEGVFGLPGVEPEIVEGRILRARIQPRTVKLSDRMSRNGMDDFEIVFTCEAQEVKGV